MKALRSILAVAVFTLYAISASGARQVIPTAQNLLLQSRALSSANWTGDASGSGSAPVVTDNFTITSGAPAPTGVSVTRLQLNDGGSGFSRLTQTSGATLDLNRPYSFGFQGIRTNNGATVTIDFRQGATNTVVTVTPNWQTLFATETGDTIGGTCQVMTWSVQGTTTSVDLLVWGATLAKANWLGASDGPTTTSMLNPTTAIRNRP